MTSATSCTVITEQALQTEWKSENLFIQVTDSLDPAMPPHKVDLAATLGATSDLPLAIRKVCRYWFDPSLKTKEDVVRYINSVSRQNGFKIATLSNSKQGLDRRAQLVCSRGIVARKPRGKSGNIQTTTARPTKTEEKCPFSITIYECHQSGRWYIRKYGNGDRRHCGHCRLPPEQVGVRRFQSLSERLGEGWSSKEDPNSQNIPNQTLHRGEKQVYEKLQRASLLRAKEIDRARISNLANDNLYRNIIGNGLSHHSLTKMIELRRLQEMIAARNSSILTNDLLLRERVRLLTEPSHSMPNLVNPQLLLQNRIGALSQCDPARTTVAALLNNTLSSDMSQNVGIGKDTMLSLLHPNEMTMLLKSLEMERLSSLLVQKEAMKASFNDQLRYKLNSELAAGFEHKLLPPNTVHSAAMNYDLVQMSNAIQQKINESGNQVESSRNSIHRPQPEIINHIRSLQKAPMDPIPQLSKKSSKVASKRSRNHETSPLKRAKTKK